MFPFPYMRGNNLTTENSYDKYFLPRLTLKLMEKNFMINQLMTQLNKIMKSENYQHDKVMIIQLAVY